MVIAPKLKQGFAIAYAYQSGCVMPCHAIFDKERRANAHVTRQTRTYPTCGCAEDRPPGTLMLPHANTKTNSQPNAHMQEHDGCNDMSVQAVMRTASIILEAPFIYPRPTRSSQRSSAKLRAAPRRAAKTPKGKGSAG